MNRLLLVLGGIVCLTVACQKSPKVIESKESTSSPSSSGIFTTPSSSSPSSSPTAPSGSTGLPDEVHQVVVQEVLPTTKYVYLRVTEGVENYWIATLKQEVQVGATYFYRGGLPKTNFESKEYNRVFENLVLVSKLVPPKHAGGQELPAPTKTAPPTFPATSASPPPSAPTSGNSIKIAELVENPQKYDGQTVELVGTCTKVNANIMGKNWVHLKDGSQDAFDLVITTSEVIQEGQKVHMQAVVRLNKDFGAGYRYDLILEDGRSLHP
ncbi:MAG: hypothetical protein AAF399_10225 [Bacteroidota bacterium]